MYMQVIFDTRLIDGKIYIVFQSAELMHLMSTTVFLLIIFFREKCIIFVPLYL